MSQNIETQIDKLTESAIACNEAIRELQVTTENEANMGKLSAIQTHIAAILSLSKELTLS